MMCGASKTEMFRFETDNFTVRATVEADNDVDISFDETNETRDKLASGQWTAFGTVVTVEHEGIELGRSELWDSIYAKPHEFFSDHRGADPMNRNCSIMRAIHGGKTSICHYFPEVVKEAVWSARRTLAKMPKVRAA